MMSDQKDKLAMEVVSHMMEHDLFSQWLGIEVLEIKEGFSRIKMTIRKEMINGFGIIHGGIAFSLADSAFAFACNNRNILSVKEIHNGKTTGLYHITISNQNGHPVAEFKGLCYRTDKQLIKK